MIAELTAAFGSAKAVADIIGAGKGVIDQAKLASALFDLNSRLLGTQGAMMTLQSENAELQQRVRALEAKAAERSTWIETSAAFARRQVAPGVFAFVEIGVRGEGEGIPKYCCACFDGRVKALLQQRLLDIGRMIALDCPNKHRSLEFTHYLPCDTEPSSA